MSDFSKEARLIRTAREINNYKTEWVIEKIKNQALEFELKNNKKNLIAVMGLAFKPDIDDLRESPSLYETRSLQMQDFNVITIEPNISHSQEFELVHLQQAVQKADIIGFLVGHKEFKNTDIPKSKIVLDFVNIFNSNKKVHYILFK